MFNDRQKALEELEAELLREELAEEEETAPEEPQYRNYSNHYGNIEAYNRDVQAQELEDYVEQVRDGGKNRSIKGLVALTLILVAAIFLMLALWVMRYR